MPFDDLFAEAERQLNVCNSCRYCAGYCPVWPALELRTNLTEGDITHLSNLCHDCRDCFTACMYTAPHEFALNPPEIFTRVRERTYAEYVWPRSLPAALRGWRGVAIGLLAATAVLLGLSLATNGGAVFAGPVTGSPYELLGHGLMITLVLVPTFWTVGVMTVALARYWRDTHGSFRDLLNRPAWEKTFGQTATLRHQTGGAEGCSYEENEPSGRRRVFHQLLMYGFLLTFVSTTSAAVLENLFRLFPPYDYISVPVLTGTVGGIMAIVGCLGLMVLKRRSDYFQTTETMRGADHGLIWALLFLNVSGMAVLLTRETAAFGPLLLAHLAGILVAFGIAPYTKFVHFTYRALAVYKDNLDRVTAEAAAAPSR